MNPYGTPRRRAWRNLMVAALNAGLTQGAFRLPVAVGDDPVRATWRFDFPGGAPGIAYGHSDRWDELHVNVALHPTPEAESWIRTNSAGFVAGEAFAAGWLERRTGPYLQTGPKLFTCRAWLAPIIAAADIEPMGYVDRGTLIM